MTTGSLKPETIAELIDTLEYLKHECERDHKIDDINMIHVYRALRMVDRDREAAFVAKLAYLSSRQMLAE